MTDYGLDTLAQGWAFNFAFFAIILWALCMFFFIRAVSRAPVLEEPLPLPDKIEQRRIAIQIGREAYAEARHQWEVLCRLEGYETWEWEADELATVILQHPPEEHADALERIMDKWKPLVSESEN